MKRIFIFCVFQSILTFVFGQESSAFLSVGNIRLQIPNGYSYGYYDGINNRFVSLRTQERTGYNKNVNIVYFSKIGNFEDPDGWGYGIKNLPVLIDYINNISEIKPDYFVNAMRRNNFRNIKICETLTISRFEIFSRIFEHQIIFVDNIYCYIITISFEGLDFDLYMLQKLNEYFGKEATDQTIQTKEGTIVYDRPWIKEKRNEILDRFNNHQFINEFIQELFNESYNIINTLEIRNK